MKPRALIASTGKVVAVGAALLFSTPRAHAQVGSEVEGEAPAPRLVSGLRFSLSVEQGLAVPLTSPRAQRHLHGLAGERVDDGYRDIVDRRRRRANHAAP